MSGSTEYFIEIGATKGESEAKDTAIADNDYGGLTSDCTAIFDTVKYNGVYGLVVPVDNQKPARFNFEKDFTPTEWANKVEYTREEP